MTLAWNWREAMSKRRMGLKAGAMAAAMEVKEEPPHPVTKVAGEAAATQVMRSIHLGLGPRLYQKKRNLQETYRGHQKLGRKN